MEGLKFSEKDSEKVIEFLNFIATKASFNNLSVADTIKFYGLLVFCQKDLLKKIEANIFQVESITHKEEPIKKSVNKKVPK